MVLPVRRPSSEIDDFMSDLFKQKRLAAAKKLGIDEQKMPHHIAIVMDGNGRWAQQRGEPRFIGHREGGKRVEPIVLAADALGIEAITLYSFSLQNWKRPAMEVDFLMQLFTRYLVGIRELLMNHNIRLRHLGRIDGLPDSLKDELNKTIEITSNNTGMTLCLALNYGSREEIVDVAKTIALEVKSGDLNLDSIDEQLISNRLKTAGIPDPDLVIRTSNELRLSNFLLWQISYAELYITEKFWPDFQCEDLELAITTFANRSRRMGDVKPQE